jgi:hypothetical protein
MAKPEQIVCHTLIAQGGCAVALGEPYALRVHQVRARAARISAIFDGILHNP